MIFTKETLINQLNEIREKGWIQEKRKGNHGSAGNTLEDLLGIQENNLPIPNAAEWELKTHKINSSALVTLFHQEPSPRALKLVSDYLLPRYGWKHKEAGKKYPLTEKSFRQTINTLKFSDRGFKVVVNYKERKVQIEFNIKYVSNISYKETLAPFDKEHTPYWGFDDIFHQAGIKLKNCFFVEVETKKVNKDLFFKYSNIKMLKGFEQKLFIKSIDEGLIYIDFDARTGHNHGTKFRIHPSNIPALYAETKEI